MEYCKAPDRASHVLAVSLKIMQLSTRDYNVGFSKPIKLPTLQSSPLLSESVLAIKQLSTIDY
jgi:hypothetical protein